jgi:hypothetical protein
MHGHPGFIQKIDNDLAKISTPQQNVQRSKLVETITTNARFGKNMLIHSLYNRGRQHIFHKKVLRKKLSAQLGFKNAYQHLI